jgi:carbonic anhydrase
MAPLEHLLQKNRRWAEGTVEQDPNFFQRLVAQQRPEYLWIGCADSRVPANQIIGLAPGEVFVHRNIANLVVHTDINCLSVIEYAVEVLKVKHIIVCGHYNCGGVMAAMEDRQVGLIDNWLRHIRDVRQKHADRLAAIGDEAQRRDKLCELNVIEQVQNVCHTSIVQEAWCRGQSITVHGWIYRLHDGIIRDLHVAIASPDEISESYRLAVRGTAAP